MISKHSLFERLAEGHAAGITVVTPNARLSRTLVSEFDEFQIAKGLASWEAADILPFGAFVQRLWEDALYSDLGENLPLLLTPAQEQLLWEQILEHSGLLAISQAAAQCRDAWRLLHQWRIGPGAGNEDAAAFNAWSREYQRKAKGDIDAARLPDLMSQYIGKIRTPTLVVAYAFDILPPQTREFLGRFTLEHCSPEPAPGKSMRASFPSAKQELETAAKWARARLEQGRKRIGVVVPDLGKRRSEVVRVFSRVMQPGYNLPGGQKAPMPFNVSLGQPLSAYPLVDAALSLIELSHREVEFASASHLIRSAFVGGAETEMARRATLDARLRRKLDSSVTLPKLIASVETCPLLRKHLEAVFEIAQSKPDTAGDWARHFSAVLDAAGFPGERALDSDEFQTRAKWHEMLGELAKLERVSDGMSFQQAFACVKRLCADTLFQPESPDAPIQILGILEATGLRFDCLWVSGLTDEAWPLDARPSPFIPIALQKKAGIPQASAESSLALDRRITEEWKSAAAEVIFSCALKEQDRDLSPSPLIRDVAESAIAVPDYPRYRDLQFGVRVLTQFEDWKAPPVTVKQVRGGTRVLADQAACPFRAFAKWRLGADPLEEPAPGPDARDRGKLLHALMSSLWEQLKTSTALAKDTGPAIARAAEFAVKELRLEGRFAELERERLAKLAREWLEIEARRAPFDVAVLEQRRDLTVAGLQFSSRIDRMDRLEAGGYVLIDYKTGGNMTPKQWQGPRPDDPQLPLYAVAAPEELAAITFARLRPGEMKFIGYSRAAHLVPNVQVYRDWPGLLAAWKKDAEALGASFASGDAQVDPKEDLKTCRLCDLQTLCRVYEKFSALADDE